MEPNQEEKQGEGDPQLVEFFKVIEIASLEATLYALKKFQAKKRKVVVPPSAETSCKNRTHRKLLDSASRIEYPFITFSAKTYYILYFDDKFIDFLFLSFL